MKPVEIAETTEKKEDSSSPREDMKSGDHIDLKICKISKSMIFAYLYVFSSMLLTILVRILFGKYLFKFSFTFFLCQQFFCMSIFSYLSNHSGKFNEIVGEISLEDFLKMKYRYAIFTGLYLINQLSSFYANQLVKNTAMFLTLRKFSFVMTFLYDFFVEGKKISIMMFGSMIMIIVGSVMIAFDDFTVDIFGYIFVFVNNSLTVANAKYGESFRKNTGVPNLKLLVYNSYLIQPFLVIGVIVSGEARRLIEYFLDDSKSFSFYLSLLFIIFISCCICVLLNCSMLISYEKNSSFFTQILCGAKDILITAATYILLKDFNLSFKTVGGLLASTLGALFVSFKSIVQAFSKSDSSSQDKDAAKADPEGNQTIEMPERSKDVVLDNDSTKDENKEDI